MGGMAMTATLTRPEGVQRIFRCGYCAQGHHGSCPGAVWHTRPVLNAAGKQTGTQPVLWTCKCEEPGHPTFPYCTECKNNKPGELDLANWRCIDTYGCHGRLELRRQNSELYQMLQRCKSVSALRRKAQRLGAETMLGRIDPDEDARIEKLTAYLDELAENRKKKVRRQSSSPRQPKSTSGTCECCGEPTRGGRFLPGHDAKYISKLKAKVMEGDHNAWNEMRDRGWLRKLPNEWRQGVLPS